MADITRASTPLNWKALVPAAVSTISILLSLNVTLSCHYVSLSAPNGFIQNRGIWYLEGFERIGDTDDFKNVCIPYPAEEEMDSTWGFTRFLSLVGGIIGSATASYLWSCVLSPLSKEGWRQLTVGCALAAFTQALTFMLLSSNACRGSEWAKQSPDLRHCNPSSGFDVNCAATVFWLLTAVSMVLVPPHLTSEKEKTDENFIKDMKDAPPVKEVYPLRTPCQKDISAVKDTPDVNPGSDDDEENQQAALPTQNTTDDEDDSESVLPQVPPIAREDLPEIC